MFGIPLNLADFVTGNNDRDELLVFGTVEELKAAYRSELAEGKANGGCYDFEWLRELRAEINARTKGGE
jgi:hypothetical protein